MESCLFVKVTNLCIPCFKAMFFNFCVHGGKITWKSCYYADFDLGVREKVQHPMCLMKTQAMPYIAGPWTLY